MCVFVKYVYIFYLLLQDFYNKLLKMWKSIDKDSKKNINQTRERVLHVYCVYTKTLLKKSIEQKECYLRIKLF